MPQFGGTPGPCCSLRSPGGVGVEAYSVKASPLILAQTGVAVPLVVPLVAGSSDMMTLEELSTRLGGEI